MAISNKHGPMVATGNKSEMAVGYATSTGTWSVAMPCSRTCSRPWLRPGSVAEQVRGRDPPEHDRQTAVGRIETEPEGFGHLPPYEILDEILALYVESDLGVSAIVERGFEPALVARVAAMIDRNEYKRRQAAPGSKSR